jgi:serine/threonine protein kinase
MKLVDGKVVIKLADFGHSRELLATDKYLTRSVGTDKWRSPEQYESNVYHYPADIFALAHVFLALVVCIAEHEGCPTCKYLIAVDGRWF